MSAIDRAKLWISAILIVGSVYVAGYELAAEPTGVRVGVLVGGWLLAFLLIAFSQSGRDFVSFVRASNIELQKVIWPSRQETLQMTAVVLLLVSLIMLFLWVVDFILNNLLSVLSS